MTPDGVDSRRSRHGMCRPIRAPTHLSAPGRRDGIEGPSARGQRCGLWVPARLWDLRGSYSRLYGSFFGSAPYIERRSTIGRPSPTNPTTSQYTLSNRSFRCRCPDIRLTLSFSPTGHASILAEPQLGVAGQTTALTPDERWACRSTLVADSRPLPWRRRRNRRTQAPSDDSLMSCYSARTGTDRLKELTSQYRAAGIKPGAPLGMTSRFDRYAVPDGPLGQSVFRLLSAYAHGKQWSVLTANLGVMDRAAGIPGGAVARVSSSDHVSVTFTGIGLRTALAAVRNLEAYLGVAPADFQVDTASA
jgi:hypothetical protein